MEIVDVDDVGVTQRRNHLSFTFKTREEHGVMLKIGEKNLDRDIALQLRVKRLPHIGHATSS